MHQFGTYIKWGVKASCCAFLFAPSVSIAALNTVTDMNSGEQNPYEIAASYTGQTEQIVSAQGTTTDKAYIHFASGTSFTDNIYTDPDTVTNPPQNFYGIVINAKNAVVNFGGNNTFSGNKFDARGNTYGVIHALSEAFGETTEFNFGDGILFENNSAVMGNVIVADASKGGVNTFNFSSGVTFKNNTTSRNQVGNGGDGGAINSWVHGDDTHESANIFNFGDGILFENNRARYSGALHMDTFADDQGKAQNTFNFNGDVTFKDNIGTGGASTIYSTLYGYTGSEADFDMNFKGSVQFLNNGDKTTTGSAVYSVVEADGTGIANSNYTFDGEAVFRSNKASTGGAIYSFIYGLADTGKGLDEYTFNNKAVFDGNESAGNGGAIYAGNLTYDNSEGTIAFRFNDEALFKNNKAGQNGSVIYAIAAGEDTSKAKIYFDFLGQTSFINNTSDGAGGAISILANSSSVESANEAVLTFEPQNRGQSVLFEGNQAAGGLNSLYMTTGHVHFNLQSATYANMRDPIYTTANVTIDKDVGASGDGGGALYLWGKNSIGGQMNINAGSLYALFEEMQNAEQAAADPTGQRTDFTFGTGTLAFGADTFYRPMMNNARNQLADINIGQISGASNAVLVPYEISRLEVKDYTFTNNYDGFQGFESPLAHLIVNGTTDVRLRIKRNLEGYENLSAAADAYRRSNMDFLAREELDNIYLTGRVSDHIRDLFEVAGGSDYINYNNVHRASVRQFDRTVITRTHNKDGVNAGMDAPYNHLWISTSYNHIKKDKTAKNAGYKYDPKGVTLGYDFEWVPDSLTAGAAFSYTSGNVKTLSGDGIYAHDDVDNFLASFYGKYQPSLFYANWNIGAGYFKNKTVFKSAEIDAYGKYDNQAVFANGQIGYNIGCELTDGCFVLEPYVGAEYTHLVAQGYNEKGVGGRHFDRADWDIFETPIGVRAAHDFCIDDFILTPTADVAYAYNFGNTNIKTNAAFIGNRADVWHVASDADSRHSLRASAAFKVNHQQMPLALNIGYAVDWRSDYLDQQVYGTVRWDF